MRSVIVALILVALAAAPVVAHDLGNRAPAKPVGAVSPPAPPDPEVLRQGGDTILDAVRIPISTIDLAGTIVGYTDDYDVICPIESTSPDVVYSVVPDQDMLLNIDLCGSQYDTKVFVYDQNLHAVACNDDYYYGPPCGDYVSKIERLPVLGGNEYFIVVDGYFGDQGDYVIDVVRYLPCVLECPTGADHEGEPPLVNDYVDLHNGGCNTDEANPPFQPITAPVFCGVSGWYIFAGSTYRDTDWFTIEIPAGGVLEVTGDAELACNMFELGPQDCDGVDVVQDAVIGECAVNTMTIVGDPGSTVWFWVGPTTFTSPDGSFPYEFDYVLWLNLDVVATENHSWSEVKALFD